MHSAVAGREQKEESERIKDERERIREKGVFARYLLFTVTRLALTCC